MTERIHINGLPAEASMSSEGDLRWRVDSGTGRGEQSLTVESSVLGVTVKGREIMVKAFVGQLKNPFCGAVNLGKRVMKNFVLEMSTDVVAKIWNERLRMYMDSLGK